MKSFCAFLQHPKRKRRYALVVGAEDVDVADVESDVGDVLLGQRLPASQRLPVDRTLRTLLTSMGSTKGQRVPNKYSICKTFIKRIAQAG